ncbi:TPA: LysR family transcriptional regulator [Klebsiella aerogenes]|uniref:LysR family transcriptional regulator n=1 Tax=Klebsiella aerogenes TaxID=548 RepID=UPI0005EFC34B|nr:LysR family transcriptional regulator [Klebsiella aerogenes]EIV2085544.1 LysR family transcriptional regulator [Klebsiella aerogenes]EIW9213785.1 LysR family transcriptional regulator [Klebsiella aerogenes]EKU4514569.1 LysR family transcriptional regulator [Klebsiella aerogenes]EKU6672827.1 LysR family transcriptional regulator [Klebsiella aerogenes]EKU7555322.1 LysR family transcriptional regulator [Klebsiella aerogenes]
MDKLASMQVYVCVVDTHSFARAAEVLGLPRSTVSRVIKELESWLGIQLLQRTTRKLSVTADGRRYYDESKRLLADIATMESSFPGRSAQPKGRFKVGMPQSLARHCIIPRLPAFLRQYPELELLLCSSDNVEDIIQEGYDCVIRTGRIEDSTTLVARPLANFRWAVLASPDYIAAHGKPDNVDSLERHHAVGYLNHRTGRTTDWFFTLDDGDVAIRMKETLIVDDTDAYIQAGIQGVGLIRVASYLVAPYLQSGALVLCMENLSFDLPLSLVYPQNRYLPPSVRAFYDWSRAVLHQHGD